jgi:isoleucyl-tRNA synthetase
MSNSKTKNGKAKNLLVSDDLLEKVKGKNLVNKKYEM